MAILKNNRHEKFALAIFKGMSQKDAAIEAGYVNKGSAIDVHASRLIRNAKIFDRIQELHKQVGCEGIMSVRERKERLSEIARARLTDFVEAGADGSWINIGLESAHSAALQEVTSKTEYDENGSKPTIITKVKVHDPIRAISELNKMDGAYAPVQQEVIGGGQTLVSQTLQLIFPDGTEIIPGRMGGDSQKQLEVEASGNGYKTS